MRKPLDLTPWTTDRAEADPWLQGAEGVIAKELDAPYRPGERTGMVKVKRVRTIDTVIVGWRPGKEEGTLGSLILGLYDEQGELQVVGHSSGFRAKQKRELPGFLAPYETGERGSGDPSRWDAGRELEWRSRAARAGGRGDVRPRQRPPHPARREVQALARGQAAARVHDRPARYIGRDFLSRKSRWPNYGLPRVAADRRIGAPGIRG